MLKYRSAHNEEMLEKVHFKLQRKVDRLDSVNQVFDKIDELGGPASEALTIGTKSNNKTLMASGAVPAVPFAVGVASAILGMVSLIPAAMGPEPSMGQAQIDALKQMETFGTSALTFAGNAFGVGLKLLGVPAAVAVISIPKKIARVLAGQYDRKTAPTIEEGRKIVGMIDDVLNDVEDPTLSIPRTILTRVDLKGNSVHFNIDLLGYLARYRECLQKEKSGEAKGNESEQAFQEFIYFLEDSKHKIFGVSKKFKENNFINSLIDGFYKKKKKESEYGYSEGIKSM